MKPKDLVLEFFEAYARHDKEAIKKVMAGDVIWIFPGENPLAGMKKGIDEVVHFFNTISEIMGHSYQDVEKIVDGENDHYLLECHHLQTNRKGPYNLDNLVCVLWQVENNKIVSGRHFFSDARSASSFFSHVMREKKFTDFHTGRT